MSSFVLRASDVLENLKSQPKTGKNMLNPLLGLAQLHNLPFKILEDCAVENAPEVHRLEGDLWHCLEGKVTFVCGGELVEPNNALRSDGTENPNEISGKSIAGGTQIILQVGDWLWIPAGEPHSHRSEGIARLFIIKIPSSV